jgi:hypothetical protein
MTIDREVSAALDRVAAGEPVDEVADDYGVPRVFFRVFLDVQELIATASEIRRSGIINYDRLYAALKNLEEA